MAVRCDGDNAGIGRIRPNVEHRVGARHAESANKRCVGCDDEEGVTPPGKNQYAVDVDPKSLADTTLNARCTSSERDSRTASFRGWPDRYGERQHLRFPTGLLLERNDGIHTPADG